jgi:tetrahydromethanopterin S-methyltransferase subunit E
MKVAGQAAITTSMPELSPQTQEVFWAFNRAASGKPDDWHYLPAIAAALRAAGEQCTDVARTELNLIADELEGVKYGTYRCELQAQ